MSLMTGGAVISTVASQPQGLCFKSPGDQSFSVFACWLRGSPPPHPPTPRSKDIHLEGYSKLTSGPNGFFLMSWGHVQTVPCLLPAGSCDRLQPSPATPLRQKQNGLFMFLAYQSQDIYFQLLTSWKVLNWNVLNCLVLWCRVSATVLDGHAERSLRLLLSPCTHASQLFRALAALQSMATDIFSFC